MLRILAFLLIGLAAPAGLAAGREIAPESGVTPLRAGATIAAAGEGFLAVWGESRQGQGQRIFGMLLDRSGKPRTQRGFAIVTDAEPLELVGVGDGYVLFFRRSLGGPTFMLRIDAEGMVAAERRLAFSSSDSARFAWNGERFVAILDSPSGAKEALVLDRDGEIVRRGIAVEDGRLQVVGVPGAFVLLTARDNSHLGPGGLFAGRITHDGNVRRTVVVGAHHEWYGPAEFVAAAEGSSVRVVWLEQNGYPTTHELHTAVLLHDGSVVAQRRLLSTRSGVVPLAVWTDGMTSRLALQRMTLLGGGDFRHEIEILEFDEQATGSIVDAGPGFDPVSIAANDSRVAIVSARRQYGPTQVTGVDRDASNRAAHLLAFGPSEQRQPVLAAAGDRVIAAWAELADDEPTLRSAVLTADGQPLAAQTISAGTTDVLDMAWNGREFLVLHWDEERLLATRLDAGGAPAGEHPIVVGDCVYCGYPFPAVGVAWTGRGWAVAWVNEGRLRYATLTSRGDLVGGTELSFDTPIREGWIRDHDDVALSFDGARLLIAWNEMQSNGCLFPGCAEAVYRTFVAQIDPAGRLQDGAILEVAQLAAGDEPGRLRLASSGEGAMLLRDAEVVGMQTAPLRIAGSRRLIEWPVRGDIAWSGQNYVVALQYGNLPSHWTTPFQLALWRLDGAANVVGSPVGIATQARSDPFRPPSVAAANPASTLIGVVEESFERGTRAVTYSELELPPLVPPPAPPSSVDVRPRRTGYGEYRYEITWAPPQQGEPLFYQVACGGDDRGYSPIFPPHERRYVAHCPDVAVRAFGAGGFSAWATDPAPWRVRGVRK